MKNFVLISPNFPKTYYHFAKALKNIGFRVLGIGDEPLNSISNNLKESLDEYVPCFNMENIKNQIEAVNYLKEKYGQIDFIESNNEYWLHNDAILREWFNVPSGVWPKELLSWQKKSEMKKRFLEAGCLVADYIIPHTREDMYSFANKKGYPLFIKPNIGMGSIDSFTAKCAEDIESFFNKKEDDVEYICEQYIFGDIVSFDGLADSNSNVTFCCSHEFPPSISDIANDKKELIYFTNKEVPTKLKELGKKIVKAFKIRKRFFHIEFFRLSKDMVGVGNAGDYVAIEANMRTPGGYTTDMINYSQSISCYELYAQIMMDDKLLTDINCPHYYCCCASRRDGKEYQLSIEDIQEKYKSNICMSGRFPIAISLDMGNDFIVAKFLEYDMLLEFKKDMIK